VLLVPRATGLDSLVWSLPVAALIMSLWFLIRAFSRSRQNKPTPPSAQDEKLVEQALAESMTKLKRS